MHDVITFQKPPGGQERAPVSLQTIEPTRFPQRFEAGHPRVQQKAVEHVKGFDVSPTRFEQKAPLHARMHQPYEPSAEI